MAKRRAERRPAWAEGGALAAREVALLAAGFAALALAVYAPALTGPFLSDDLHYVATNPYVHDLSLENLVAIFDPGSPATVFVVNYAPVHLLLHAIGAALLAAVFVRAGLSRLVGIGAALVFLVHPANVEAVAWISQAKTPAAFALSMAALLAHPRRPALGVLLFGFALLAKPTAAFALPVAMLLDWTRERRIAFAWLAAWAALLAGYAVAEFATHQRTGAAEPVAEDVLVRLRTSVAIGARYFWMAATSLGVSTFHEPAPVRSWLDPVWLAGAASMTAIAVRAGVALRRRSPEIAFWVWAGASFFPISQLFPFLYPMADRYLYFILPGLLGGVLFVARDASARFAARPPAWLPRAAAIGAGALVLAFAVHSFARAGIWASPARVIADAATHYPDGRNASILEAKRAALAGDSDAAFAALRRAWERGFNRFEQIQGDPGLAPLRGDPRFDALVNEIAGWWVSKLSDREHPTQMELRTLAIAHLARRERAEAITALERAIAAEGPLDAQLREELAQVRQMPR
ncbi:MAG: hypothetical protein MUF70_04940 [Myxococcota bacterium]|nr:hypothetical protein [Myxococcota bacterium]